MKTTSRIAFLLAGLLLSGASVARAQAVAAEPKLFIDANFGISALPSTLNASSTFPLFAETAVVSSSEKPAVAPVFDMRVGVRPWQRFGLALGISASNGNANGTATASVPSAIFFNSPTMMDIQESGLKRREFGFHVQALWFLPISDKLELAIGAGPSLVHVEQAIMTVNPPSGTGDPTSGSINRVGTAKGGNAGVDATFKLSARLGVGFFARYVAASGDLPDMPGVKVRGLQSGGGIRLKF